MEYRNVRLADIVLDGTKPPQAVVDIREPYAGLELKTGKGRDAFYKWIKDKGVNVDFVESDQDLRHYHKDGKPLAGAAPYKGNTVKVAKIVNGKRISEKTRQANVAHEVCHKLYPTAGHMDVQNYAIEALRSFGLEESAVEAERIGKNLARLEAA